MKSSKRTQHTRPYTPRDGTSSRREKHWSMSHKILEQRKAALGNQVSPRKDRGPKEEVRKTSARSSTSKQVNRSAPARPIGSRQGAGAKQANRRVPSRTHNARRVQASRWRSVKWLSWTILAVAYICVSTSLWLFHGPFHHVKTAVIDTVDETRHGYLLKPISLYTLPQSVIKAHALSNELISVTKPVDQIQRVTFPKRAGITLTHYNGSTFRADVLLVKDPNRIKVIATKYIGKRGETVQQMVRDVGAVAGINGGSFNDAKWQGTGADPQGITMHDGKLITNIGNQTVIAFREGGQMIAGHYTLAQLKKLDVQEAVSFGPVLVENGKPVQVTDQGYDIRTAIGETAHGEVILMVTNGRGLGGAGASMAQVAKAMLHYHAVIAANLDGGSSSTMVYNNKLVNTPWDIMGARYVGTSVVVMPEK